MLWCNRGGASEGPVKVILLVGLAVAIWLLHRLALWMEAQGWLYYWHRRPSRSALGNAFLEVQQLVEPAQRPVLEAKREERAEREDPGDPPDRSH